MDPNIKYSIYFFAIAIFCFWRQSRYKFDPTKGVDFEIKEKRISPSVTKLRYLIGAVVGIVCGVLILMRSLIQK